MKFLHKWLACGLILSATASANTFDWALYGVSGNDFHSGLATSIQNVDGVYLYGFINASGNVVIPYQYKFANDFDGYSALVGTDEGQGLINTRGEYILPIGNYNVRKSDTMTQRMPGACEVIDKSTGKTAFFDGNRFITGFDYEYFSDYNFPFISMSNKGEREYALIYNVVTQDTFRGGTVLQKGNYFVVNVGDDVFVYDRGGEPVDKSKFMKSSKGAEVFHDSSTGLAGIRNSVTGAVVQPARYKVSPRFKDPLWIGDVVILYDSINPECRFMGVVFDAGGQKIAAADPVAQMIYVGKDFINKSGHDINEHSTNQYFSFDGKEITELRGTSPFEVCPGYYFYSKNHTLYNINTHKQYKYVDTPVVSEGMIRFRNTKDEKYYYLNLSTGKILGPYKMAHDFNEGVAVVTKSDKASIINKEGKEFTFPDNIEISANYISEGVVKARDKNNYVNGYIYNPFGHEGWEYTQTAGSIHTAAYYQLEREAEALAAEKKYAAAMNKFYMLMMLRPQENVPFNNYAWCLYSLGRLDEALTAIDVALSYWPNDEYALDLRKTIVQRMEYEAQKAAEAARVADEEEYYVEDTVDSFSVWDAIGNFANVLSTAFGTYNASAAYVPSYSSGSMSSYSSESGVSGGNYQAEYDRWASRAEHDYNSLTNLGYSATYSSGKKSGGSGNGRLSSGNFIQMKRSLREAQSQMRKIRRQAAREGVTIRESQYENASVSF